MSPSEVRISFEPVRLICHSFEPEDLISQRIEALEGMLKREFIGWPLQVNLQAVITGYKTEGHALQELERKEIHVYGGGQFLGTAATTDAACDLYDRARGEGRVAAEARIWLEDVSFFPCHMIQVFNALTRQPVSYEEEAYISRVYCTVRLGSRVESM